MAGKEKPPWPGSRWAVRFELLKPLDADRHAWLVLTRWRDEESFQNWITSANFKGAHGGRDTEISRQHGASDAGGPPPHGDARPVDVTAELWSYGVVDLT